MKQNTTLFFPATIYPQDIIQQAVKDYAKICRIELRKTEDGVECAFLKSVTDLELTAREFSNYLVELINAGAGGNE